LLGEQIDAWAADAVERDERVKPLEEQLAVASTAAQENEANAQRLSAPPRRLSALLRGGRQA
jgi:hypothetical protein